VFRFAYNTNTTPHFGRVIATLGEKRDKVMPVISRFLGIVIAMYWDDHSPPHFHAKYGEYEITVDIHTGVVAGKFPKRALRHVLEWYELHKDELLEDWDLCRNQQMLNPIEPLE
jgi:hypothetical protein